MEEHQQRKQHLAESLHINSSAESITKGSVVLFHSTANNMQNEKNSAKCTENAGNVMSLLSLDCLLWVAQLTRTRDKEISHSPEHNRKQTILCKIPLVKKINK